MQTMTSQGARFDERLAALRAAVDDDRPPILIGLAPTTLERLDDVADDLETFARDLRRGDLTTRKAAGLLDGLARDVRSTLEPSR